MADTEIIPVIDLVLTWLAPPGQLTAPLENFGSR
jgi:hypothetical protein